MFPLNLLNKNKINRPLCCLSKLNVNKENGHGGKESFLKSKFKTQFMLHGKQSHPIKMFEMELTISFSIWCSSVNNARRCTFAQLLNSQ